MARGGCFQVASQEGQGMESGPGGVRADFSRIPRINTSANVGKKKQHF